MALSKITLAAFAAGALGALGAQPVLAQAAGGDLAAASLAEGREKEAIIALERQREAAPRDAAVLINLGIAYAQAGDDLRAKEMFEDALTAEDVILLRTAAGDDTDSRRLARKALRMLANGEFRSQAPREESLTMRD